MPDWIEDKVEENVTKKQTVLCKKIESVLVFIYSYGKWTYGRISDNNKMSQGREVFNDFNQKKEVGVKEIHARGKIIVGVVV